ncbi:hypothetical protein N9937_01960 [bacterium]|nr:hypothetical protein [bacterium]
MQSNYPYLRETNERLTTINGGSLGVGDLTTDAWGVQKVSLPHSIFHGMWTFDIPQSMWFMYENDVQVYTSTNIVSSGGAAVLTADATNSSVILESRECPRYQPNRGHLFSTAVICPNKTADAHRMWGLALHGENEIQFQLKSDGLLYAQRTSANVLLNDEVIDTSVVPSFDVEKGNIYDIQYQWRGVGNYLFFINNCLVHELNLLGTLTEVSLQNPALPVHFHVERGTEDASMKIGCVDITSENGASQDQEQYGSIYAEAVAISTDTPVVVLHQPETIGAYVNTRTLTLARISVTCSKKGTFKVWTTRNPTNITGATYVAATGGFVETDSPDTATGAVRATAVTIANMDFVTAIPVEAAVTRSVDNPYRGRIEFPLVRGDYLVVTGTAATASADCVIEFGQQI